jgi:Family of unknown function (DUF6252)
MKRVLGRTLVVVGLLVVGCGGGDGSPTGTGNGGGGGGTSPMSATIDGAKWTASKSAVQVSGNTTSTAQGTITISGVNINTGFGITISLSYVSAAGTYPLGVNIGTNAGGTATVTESPNFWNTPLNGAAGTVVITTRTATRIAGTFEFTATPIVGGGANAVVTGGAFDITVSAGLPPLPTGDPSSISATFDGGPWNAATVVAVGGGVSFGGTTTDYTLNLTGKLPITAGAAYKIGSEFGCQITRTGTMDAWAATTEDSVGYVSFVAVSPTRILGYFAGTLPPLGSTPAALEIGNGFFNVQIQ